MLAFQSASINGSKLDAPETDRRPSDDDSSCNQEVFDFTVTEIETVAEPDSVTDNAGWQSIAFIYRNVLIVTHSAG